MTNAIHRPKAAAKVQAAANAQCSANFLLGQSEAIIAQELEIPYASLCSVDNFAHGLEEKALTMEKVLWHARHNAEAILRILTRYIERDARTAERA